MYLLWRQSHCTLGLPASWAGHLTPGHCPQLLFPTFHIELGKYVAMQNKEEVASLFQGTLVSFHVSFRIPCISKWRKWSETAW